MILITARSKEPIEVKVLEVTIGENRYRISESIDGKLNINKPEMDAGTLAVMPRYANEIEII